MTPEDQKKWTEEFQNYKSKQLKQFVSSHAIETIYFEDLNIYINACLKRKDEIGELAFQLSCAQKVGIEYGKTIDKLDKELQQQKFNNKHNLSIDQKVSDEIENLKQENKKFKEELVKCGQYGTNPEIENCICPKFYKKDSPFSGVSYYCPLHGR